VAASDRRRSRRLDRGPVKVLTDTHTLVWALSEPEAVGAQARAALAESPFTASVANLWELVLKSLKPGALIADPLPWWEKYVVRAHSGPCHPHHSYPRPGETASSSQRSLRPHPGGSGPRRRAYTRDKRRCPRSLRCSDRVGLTRHAGLPPRYADLDGRGATVSSQSLQTRPPCEQVTTVPDKPHTISRNYAESRWWRESGKRAPTEPTQAGLKAHRRLSGHGSKRNVTAAFGSRLCRDR
jgi:hypothetical protein